MCYCADYAVRHQRISYSAFMIYHRSENLLVNIVSDGLFEIEIKFKGITMKG